MNRSHLVAPVLLATAAAGLAVGGLVAGPAGAANHAKAHRQAKEITRLEGTITVAAASSLTKTFTTLGAGFQRANPGAGVIFNFGSSATLAKQIQLKAPVDVFASADVAQMTLVQRSKDLATKPVLFARNTLEIVVKPGNPLHIKSVADLSRAKVVSICAPTAPCGVVARQVLAKDRVVIPTAKETVGTDAEVTLAAVTTGDADAALVYVTDAKQAKGASQAVKVTSATNVVTSYPIAVVKGTKNEPLAKAWVAYVNGPVGQKALRAAGFLPPR